MYYNTLYPNYSKPLFKTVWNFLHAHTVLKAGLNISYNINKYKLESDSVCILRIKINTRPHKL